MTKVVPMEDIIKHILETKVKTAWYLKKIWELKEPKSKQNGPIWIVVFQILYSL